MVGVDIHKAFSNVAHSGIHDELALTKAGEKMFTFIKDFLSNRAITIKVGGYISPKQKLQLRYRKKPFFQPAIFKLSLKDLPGQLERIPDLNSALYADDTTLWCDRGSPAHQGKAIQKGLDTMQTSTKTIGLRCAPEKSECIVVLDGNTKPSEETRNLITRK